METVNNGWQEVHDNMERAEKHREAGRRLDEMDARYRQNYSDYLHFMHMQAVEKVKAIEAEMRNAGFLFRV